MCFFGVFCGYWGYWFFGRVVFFFWGGQWLNRVFFRKKMVSIGVFRCFFLVFFGGIGFLVELVFFGGQWLNRVFFRKKMVSRCF